MRLKPGADEKDLGKVFELKKQSEVPNDTPPKAARPSKARTYYLEPEIIEALRQEAFKRNMKLSTILNDVLRDYFNRDNNKGQI